MKVELLQPDTVPPSSGRSPILGLEPRSASGGWAEMLDQIGKVLTNATHAEDAYASGTGSLQEAMYQRAQADIALSIATAAAQRAAQVVQTLMNLQI
jgi:flagellar hook-basal body complex protein FliE